MRYWCMISSLEILRNRFKLRHRTIIIALESILFYPIGYPLVRNDRTCLTVKITSTEIMVVHTNDEFETNTRY